MKKKIMQWSDWCELYSERGLSMVTDALGENVPAWSNECPGLKICWDDYAIQLQNGRILDPMAWWKPSDERGMVRAALLRFDMELVYANLRPAGVRYMFGQKMDHPLGFIPMYGADLHRPVNMDALLLKLDWTRTGGIDPQNWEAEVRKVFRSGMYYSHCYTKEDGDSGSWYFMLPNDSSFDPDYNTGILWRDMLLQIYQLDAAE